MKKPPDILDMFLKTIYFSSKLFPARTFPITKAVTRRCHMMPYNRQSLIFEIVTTKFEYNTTNRFRVIITPRIWFSLETSFVWLPNPNSANPSKGWCNSFIVKTSVYQTLWCTQKPLRIRVMRFSLLFMVFLLGCRLIVAMSVVVRISCTAKRNWCDFKDRNEFVFEVDIVWVLIIVSPLGDVNLLLMKRSTYIYI